MSVSGILRILSDAVNLPPSPPNDVESVANALDSLTKSDESAKNVVVDAIVDTFWTLDALLDEDPDSPQASNDRPLNPKRQILANVLRQLNVSLSLLFFFR